ncbi:bifunctional metallophosphatase/5'-nucleotidase [Ostreiculturibacter nitratireducens]|uniref:bifunctional metallophosphatase/5'-nucleotidase n=1 Tax=Ostreiculturibacter nitratireducens TaxID=3075226 RepID=UPI0031B60821
MSIRLLAAFGFLLVGTGPGLADFDLTILHTNDFHSRFKPITADGLDCPEADDAKGACYGGAARLATAIAEARARSDNSILLDAGDQFSGTDFFRYYRGRLAAEMMNGFGFDAMTLGNHEFDEGAEVLGQFCELLDAPVLVSNIDVGSEPELSGAIQSSTVIERSGERLGIVGVTLQDMHSMSQPGKNVSFDNPFRAVRAEVERLDRIGVNKIIVLSHLGYEMDKELARETYGIDVIVGGHSHILLSNRDPAASGKYPTMIGKTAIVQLYPYGKYLGSLRVTFDDEGTVTKASGEPILLDSAIAADEATAKIIAEAEERLADLGARAIAEATGPIDGEQDSCRTGECALGNLVTDAMLHYARDRGVQISVLPAAGILTSINGGAVTFPDVRASLRGEDRLAWLQVSGATVLEALEHGVASGEELSERFPQVSGLKFTFDPEAEPGSRVSDVMVSEGDVLVPLKRGKIYGVATSAWVRNGGFGYDMFEDPLYYFDYGPLLSDVTADFLRDNSPYSPNPGGRILPKAN